MKEQTEAKQYIEPDGFKGTKGEWYRNSSGDIKDDADKIIGCAFRCEADAAIFQHSKELAKALQDIIENAAPVPDYPGEFFLHKLSIENAKQVLKQAGL